MGRKIVHNNITKDVLAQDIEAVMSEHHLSNITQREYFNLGKFSEFIFRKYGFKFSDITSLLGLDKNSGGKRVAQLTPETRKKYDRLESYMPPPKLTGDTKDCLKCEESFKQTNYNMFVCPVCDGKNKVMYSEKVEYALHR